jgi:hypothetical protein
LDTHVDVVAVAEGLVGGYSTTLKSLAHYGAADAGEVR